MGEWKTEALGILGSTYTGLSGKSAADFGHGTPYIPYLNVFNNAKVEVDQLEYVSIEPHERQNAVNKGDIIFTTSSETPEEVGMSSVLTKNIGIVYLNSFCFGWRLKKPEMFHSEFLAYALRSQDIRHQMLIAAQGSTRHNLSKKNFNKIRLKYPVSTTEQSGIAEVLSGADEAINKTRALVEKHRNIKAGLMKDLLLNTNWAPGVFTDIADVNPRIAKGIQPLDEVDFIPMQDVNEYGVWDIKETRLAKDCMSGFTIFAENDVLFAKITPCMENGKGCIAEGLRCSIGFGSTEFHVLRAKANADPRFIYQWSIFPYLRQKAVAFMTGSAGQQRVSADFFAKLKIGIPQKPEQQRIAGILTTADKKIQTEQAYLAKLQDIKRGLMQDLLPNKVSVDALM